MTDLMHFKPALQKPAAFPNVQTIGYVPTENGTRATTAVQRDVLQYSVWSNMPLNCTLNGIFFDETPYVRGNQTEDYLTIINGWAKGANGIESPKTVSTFEPVIDVADASADHPQASWYSRLWFSPGRRYSL